MQPRDSHVTAPAEIRRLTGQNLRVYHRLCQGPATRRDLGSYALNVTARISDLRVHLKPLGQDIKVTEHPNGLSLYRIVDVPSVESGEHKHDDDLTRTGELAVDPSPQHASADEAAS